MCIHAVLQQGQVAMYLHMHIQYVCMYVLYMSVHVYVLTYACIYLSFILYVHTYVRTYMCTFVCMYLLYLNVCIYVCVCTCTCTYIHNYVHTPCTCSQNSLRMMQSLKGSRASNKKVVRLQMDCTCPIHSYKLNSQVILKSHCSIPIWVAGSPASMECAHTSTYVRTYVCICASVCI